MPNAAADTSRVRAQELTVREASQLTGYHRAYLRHLIHEKQIIARKIRVKSPPYIMYMIDRNSLLSYTRQTIDALTS